MKTFKGTKGEWFPNVISTITIGVNAEIEKADTGTYSQNVCEFILPESDDEYEKEREEREANAKLIAAAPDLLEALLKVEPLMKAGFENSPLHLKIKKAISKALD